MLWRFYQKRIALARSMLESNQAKSDQPPDDRPEIGVLFVHGIGQQQPGQALLQFGEPVRRHIERSLRGRLSPAMAALLEQSQLCRVASARLSEGANEPPAVILEFKTVVDGKTPRTHRWLMAESRWADTFKGSSYWRLLKWLMSRGWWAVVLHLAAYSREIRRLLDDGLKAAENATNREERNEATRLMSMGSTKSFLLAFTSVILIAIYFITLALAVALPILRLLPFSRSFSREVQRLMAGIIGDAVIFTTSPIEQAAIRTRFIADLAWLATNCERTVVVAHSQGAAVVADGLSQPGTVPENLKALVTFGSGNRKLFGLQDLPFVKLRARALVGSAFVSGLAVWMILLWLILGNAGGLVAISWSVALVFSFLWTWSTALGLALIIDFRGDLPLTRVHWTDFSATRDPVSAGPLPAIPTPSMNWPSPTSDAAQNLLTSLENAIHELETTLRKVLPGRRALVVHNRGSWLEDHTTYWENIEQFVAVVVQIIAGAADTNPPDSTEKLQTETALGSMRGGANLRRIWRVRLLIWFRRLRLIAFAALLVGFWTELRSTADLGLERIDNVLLKSVGLSIPAWLRVSETFHQAVAIALVAAPLSILYRANLSLWLAWESSELSYAFNLRDSYPSLPLLGGLFVAIAIATGGLAIWGIVMGGLPLPLTLVPFLCASLMVVAFFRRPSDTTA